MKNLLANSSMEFFGVAYQFYLIPTIKITHDKLLNGCYEFQLIWFNRGISFNYETINYNKEWKEN